MLAAGSGLNVPIAGSPYESPGLPSSFGPLRGIRPVGDMMESSESASKCRTRVDTSLTKDGVTSAWLPCDELSESIRDPFTRVGARTGGTGLFLCAKFPSVRKPVRFFRPAVAVSEPEPELGTLRRR